MSSRIILAVLCVSLPAAAADEIRLAAPGFNVVNVDEKLGAFVADHFGQRLSLQGLRVISAAEVQALVGVERQRQLLGCSEGSSSCLTELAGALGADGVISGSIGKFGSIYQVNIKVLSATDAKALSIVSKKAFSDEDLIEMLNESAVDVASDLKRKLNRSGTAASAAVTEDPPETADPAPPPDRERPAEEDVPAQPAAVKKPARLNAISLNLAPLFVGAFNPEYERTLAPHFTIFVAPSFSVLASEVLVGGRAYLFPDSPSGLGISAGIGGGALAGLGYLGLLLEALYTFRIADAFLLTLGGGVAIVAPLADGYDALIGGSVRGAVGYSF